MHILFIGDEVPYPLHTGYARIFHLLRRVSRRHSITLATLTARRSIAPADLEALRACAQRVVIFGLADEGEPRLIRYAGYIPGIGKRLQTRLCFRRAARCMHAALEPLLRSTRFDLVLFSSKKATAALGRVRHLPLVVDCCDAEHLRLRGEMAHAGLLRRAWLLFRLQEERRIERTLVAASPYVFCTSLRDHAALLPNRTRGEVIPLGVDTQAWTRRQRPRSDTLVFTGAMDFPPNHDAALLLGERILPLIRKSVPAVRVLLVGRDPLPELRRRARSWGNVTVTGTVEDIRPFLEEATVFAAPLRFASGTQNKVLEALAMTVPVVTTSAVVAGLQVAPNLDPPVCVADQPEEFAERVVHLFRSPAERSWLAAEGRRFVESYFDWDKSAAQLEDLCFRAAGRCMSRYA